VLQKFSATAYLLALIESDHVCACVHSSYFVFLQCVQFKKIPYKKIYRPYFRKSNWISLGGIAHLFHYIFAVADQAMSSEP